MKFVLAMIFCFVALFGYANEIVVVLNEEQEEAWRNILQINELAELTPQFQEYIIKIAEDRIVEDIKNEIGKMTKEEMVEVLKGHKRIKKDK